MSYNVPNGLSQYDFLLIYMAYLLYYLLLVNMICSCLSLQFIVNISKQCYSDLPTHSLLSGVGIIVSHISLRPHVEVSHLNRSSNMAKKKRLLLRFACYYCKFGKKASIVNNMGVLTAETSIKLLFGFPFYYYYYFCLCSIKQSGWWGKIVWEISQAWVKSGSISISSYLWIL